MDCSTKWYTLLTPVPKDEFARHRVEPDGESNLACRVGERFPPLPRSAARAKWESAFAGRESADRCHHPGE